MKKIILVANFVGDFNGESNNRFNYIFNLLNKNDNYKVELVTSDFSHNKKEKRQINTSDNDVTFIHEPSYKKNVSLKRLYSHWVFGNNVYKYIKKQKFDVLYLGVPSLQMPYKLIKKYKKRDVLILTDIQDLWPEAFLMINRNLFIKKILLAPLRYKADFIYKYSNFNIAVSKTYLSRALSTNKNNKGEVIYLGTSLERFDHFASYEPVIQKHNGEMFIAYAGTLGHSYDIKTMIDAFLLIENDEKKIKLLIMGDGPLESVFKEHAGNNTCIIFTGRLAYANMVSQLIISDIAVNTISQGAAQSIINKHADYAAAGLPVINNQENNEYHELISDYECGINCKNNNIQDLHEAMLTLIKNKELRIKYGLNSRRLAEEIFNRDVTYRRIPEIILELER